MFNFEAEVYDDKGNLVTRNVFRFNSNEYSIITGEHLKELDRHIYRHETVSLRECFKGCQGLTGDVFPVGFDTRMLLIWNVCFMNVIILIH